MADTKISDLTELTQRREEDELVVVETSSGITKRIGAEKITPALLLSDYDGDLAAAIAAIGATERTLIINVAPDTLTANATTPSTLHAHWLKGCVLDIDTYTLTFNGPLTAGKYQLFEGTGTIAGAQNHLFIPDDWFDGAETVTMTTSISAGDKTQAIATLGITATGAEINTVADGISATAAEINAAIVGLTAIAAELNTVADGAAAKNSHVHIQQEAYYSIFQRSQFSYNDVDQIDCGAAQYVCKDKYAYWVTAITTVATGAGGGADIWYLYLDYSAITSGTPITNSELIWSTTAPTWNTTYRQLMNGDDRCIFAVRTIVATSAIAEFFHAGDTVIYADNITAFSIADPTTSFVDLDLSASVPGFATEAILTGSLFYVDGTSTASWRTNGQSGTVGHVWGQVPAAATNNSVNTFIVITDSAQVIEHKISANNNTVQIVVNGWKFPIGM